jgi:hypothetical protein
MTRLLVIIPGFGPGQIELKQRILAQNLERIRRTYSGTVTIQVFNYGDISCGVPDVTEIFQRGYVGQFLFRYVKPQLVTAYDNIIVLLDDIELDESFHTDEMITNLTTHSLDILSPALTPTSKFSHKTMLQQTSNPGFIRETTFVEFFCYVMTPSSYAKWHAMMDERSAWLWGIDVGLYNNGFKLGIYDGVTIHHHIKGDSYTSNAPSPQVELRHNTLRFACSHDVTYKPPLRLIPWIELPNKV